MADRRGRIRARAAAPLVAAAFTFALLACAPSPPATPTPAPTATPFATITATMIPTQSAASPSPTLLPSPAGTGISGAQPCTASQLKASHGIVEGAAGSRLTEVVLVASESCSVDAFPAFGIRDANGAELVGSVAGGPGRIDLDPDASYQSALRFANWCGTDPTFPLSLVLRVGAEEVDVTGSSFPDEGDLPPCNGGGGPLLEAAAWEVAP